MKKIFALIICAVIVLTCFTACKPKADVITDAANNHYAAVTEDNGGLVRDQAGNIIVHVTDANGRQVEGEDGEPVTTPLALEHAIVVGNRVEAPLYSITIPNGWSDKLTVTDLDIMKDGTKDNLRIAVVKDTSYNDLLSSRSSTINLVASNYPASETGNKAITLKNGTEANYMYGWVEDTGVREDDGKGNLTILSSFIGFIIFEHAGDLYCCSLTSNQNMNEDIDDIIDILDSIEFVK